MSKIIGIDLGTSNSECAVIEGGRPITIASSEGSKLFPSIVAFTKDGQRLVGEPAKRQAVTNPERTLSGVKRKMGTKNKFKIDNKEYTPQEISAMILQKIKEDASNYLGEEITQAVVTVPAYFDDNQRQATKDSGKIAGLEVLRIINEPTAASLAYGIDKGDKELKILIFDLGGGTLDVTILEFGGGVFEVISTSGDTHLGGRDMDDLLLNYVADDFKKNSGIDLRNDNMALMRVKEAVENAKIELSSSIETQINLPFVTADANGPKHLNMTISRAKLEELVLPIIEKCEGPVKQALKDSKMTVDNIDKVILVGGPSRMPIVQTLIERWVKKPERGIDPMECVAMGAAIQGGILSGEVKEDIVLLDVTPLTLGVETLGGILTPLISRNTTIPTKKSQTFSTAQDNQTTVTIHILQGERQMTADNTSLGMFNLVGIPPSPRGLPQIEVTFDIDANGIINVSAKDLGTGKEQKMTITASTKLADDEIDKMVKDAKEHEEEDKKRKEEVEIRNNTESTIYMAEKTLKEVADKINDDLKEKVEKAIEEVKNAKEKDDIAEMKKKTEELTQTLQEIGAMIYQQIAQEQAQQQQTQGESQQDDSKRDENVVDADYEVVDEEKENE